MNNYIDFQDFSEEANNESDPFTKFDNPKLNLINTPSPNKKKTPNPPKYKIQHKRTRSNPFSNRTVNRSQPTLQDYLNLQTKKSSRRVSPSTNQFKISKQKRGNLSYLMSSLGEF